MADFDLEPGFELTDWKFNPQFSAHEAEMYYRWWHDGPDGPRELHAAVPVVYHATALRTLGTQAALREHIAFLVMDAVFKLKRYAAENSDSLYAQMGAPVAKQLAQSFASVAKRVLESRGERTSMRNIARIVGESPGNFHSAVLGTRGGTVQRVAGWCERWGKAGYPSIGLCVEAHKAWAYLVEG